MTVCVCYSVGLLRAEIESAKPNNNSLIVIDRFEISCWTVVSKVFNLVACTNSFFMQELCSREEALTRATLQHKLHEEYLREREYELHLRELTIVEREITMHLGATNTPKPYPAKRKNKFTRSKVLKQGGISEPTGW